MALVSWGALCKEGRRYILRSMLPTETCMTGQGAVTLLQLEHEHEPVPTVPEYMHELGTAIQRFGRHPMM